MSKTSIIFNDQRLFNGGTQVYPLFMGERMGLHDMVDTTYPQIEDLALLQRSQYWTETEIDLSKDKLQWSSLKSNEQDISILNLSWQSLGDTVAGRAPLLSILPFVTNPELEELLNWWQIFEQIHSRAYQHIIRTVFPDPERVRDAVAQNENAMSRLSVLTTSFEELNLLSAQYTMDSYKGNPYLTHSKREYQLVIIKALASLYALESIQFFASFACTFGLAELNIMTGVADELRLIAKDEALHTRFTHAIINIIRKDPEYADILAEVEAHFHDTLHKVELLEREWATYLFSEGRHIIGLNADLLIEYIRYLRTTAIKAIGFDDRVDIHGEGSIKNPLPWMDKYLDPKIIQVAPQERNITSYRIGSIDAGTNIDVSGIANDDFEF